MLYQQEDKQNILLSVNELAQSINSNSDFATKMSLLVEATSNLPLSHLDTWERLIRWELFQALEAPKFSRWKRRTEPIPPLGWLDLCNQDGFRREKALRELSEPAPNRFFFALAVRRLNDWVPQVREATREKLLTLAKLSDPEHVVYVLCATLPYWASWGRLEDADRQILLDIMTIEDVAHLLKLRIISTPSGPMPSILAQAGRVDMLDKSLGEIAKNAIQPAVRAKAYRSQLEGKVVWFEGRKWEWTDIRYSKGRLQPIVSERRLSVKSPFLETLKLAVEDRSPIVRRVAGDILIQKLTSMGEDAFMLAKQLASDPSPSVAERGAFVLKKLED